MNKTKKIILEKIKKGEVKMKPRWWFVAMATGMNTGFWLSVTLAALGVSSLWYFLDLYRPTEWGEYAELGLGIVLEDFPIYGSMAMLICGILGIILNLNRGENYRKSVRNIVIITIMLILAGAMVVVLSRSLL